MLRRKNLKTRNILGYKFSIITTIIIILMIIKRNNIDNSTNNNNDDSNNNIIAIPTVDDVNPIAIVTMIFTLLII